MNAVATEVKELPLPVSRRGITEAQWRTLMGSLFPGAKPESVMLVWDYCTARKLDPMKKPCHIVPMRVGDSWRDVVMPGIYEYRVTANRTGEYMGHSKPTYGPEIEYLGLKAPEFCELTVYRWNSKANMRAEYPVQIRFSECAATYYDKDAKAQKVNARWTKAPQQMLTKCTEAAGLREAFPDELGGEHTAEEMMDQSAPIDITPRIDPRGDTSGVDWEMRDRHVTAITDLLAQDKNEIEISKDLNDYIAEFLNGFEALYITVLDKLAADKIINKTKWREYLRLADGGGR